MTASYPRSHGIGVVLAAVAAAASQEAQEDAQDAVEGLGGPSGRVQPVEGRSGGLDRG